MVEDFTPRNYQVELMKVALKKNTIIFLPTGSGKTFIAILVLKQLGGSLLKRYSDGGRISMFLVNTVALVEQHAKYVRDHTIFSVGQYSGEMNIDFWSKNKWHEEFNKYQVLIMTSQILVNLVNSNFIDLNKVNLIIFDECHRGVNDQPMRQLMKNFAYLSEPPRVVGLTATLLNGNCKPHKVMHEVSTLEATYHSKVATVEGLAQVVGYSTNPAEDFIIYEDHNPSLVEVTVLKLLQKTKDIISSVKIKPTPINIKGLKPLEPEDGYRKLANLVEDLIEHVKTMGRYGGIKATLSHTTQVERLKKHCQELDFYHLLSYVLTIFSFTKELLIASIKDFDEVQQLHNFCSDKVLQLFHVFKQYKLLSREELCCIIFTKRRFTAKVIFHILDALRQHDPEYSYIKPNFMVGYNNNPYNNTREGLYQSKKNKQILENFVNKEINVLVASNVLEEGVDIPKCTLVVKFDKPDDYRSYIQSKGRARHKSSLYYMLLEQKEIGTFMVKYRDFQLVEETLNNYLIGKNSSRPDPSPEDIEKMYTEDELPPYYVNGPRSAQINMQSAIPLLCQYCNSLPSDIYTTYAPEWYLEEVNDLCRVVILLPTICPVLDLIKGEDMKNVKSAKRAAALEACKLLHQAGELDDNLIPRRTEVSEEDVNFLFTHYPVEKEPRAGNSKNKRLHDKRIPLVLEGKILPNTYCFLHIIELDPLFSRQPEDINNYTMYDIYKSSLCYGFITPNILPTLCEFPIYVSLGPINVTLKVNHTPYLLSEENINDIKRFHYLVFEDILKILQTFLIFDNSSKAGLLLIVPVNKSDYSINFDVMRQHRNVKNIEELPLEEKTTLEVSQETHLNKIVSPWYRNPGTYIVTEVSLNKNALSPFPNEDYSNFSEYFLEKHNQRIINPHLPLLLVRGITTRLNFIKPKGKAGKSKRDKIYEEMTEYLIPELVVKQEFPASLWIQANFLPTILSRVIFMLQLEQLRCRVATEAGLGEETVSERRPLQLDKYLLDYEPYAEDSLTSVANSSSPIDISEITLPATSLLYNKDFAAKMLESEYPWKDIEEPIDIDRCLNVSILDIEHFENFICHTVKDEDRQIKNEYAPKFNSKHLALTYHEYFVDKKIQMLETACTKVGPELCEVYRALTAAKANDIVNLERLETLGDSFLKFIVSVYISMRFPNYDEGRATNLKGRLVSNKNLYYLAEKKELGGMFKYHELSPKEEWLPPAFTVPEEMMNRINCKELSVNALFSLSISREEQISGQLGIATLQLIENEEYAPDENEESSYNSMAAFLKKQYVGDKHVADVVESLLGVYFKSCGITGAIKFVEWMGIIPASENLQDLLNGPSPDPVLNKNSSLMTIHDLVPCWRKIEEILDYQFNNPAYLLQAVTHSSFTPNRVTLSYEKLEFLGDAILDFLITCHIFEICEHLDPGHLTDLRSALVNNNTFASLLVRCNLHKFLLISNSKLQGYIDKFVDYLKSKNYQIDDEVLILLEEGELNLSEYVDVPKILGDVFEAIAGAIYLDSGKDLKTVWRVFYKIMWKEIDLFSKNIPKNIIRRLFEWPGAYPQFGNVMEAANQKTLIPLQFMLDGRRKCVHGCGTNKAMAKKAAAKLALRFLEM